LHGDACHQGPTLSDEFNYEQSESEVLMNFITAYIPVVRNLDSSPSIPSYPKIVGEYCVTALAPDHCEKRVAI
jgi:hypothetical protein